MTSTGIIYRLTFPDGKSYIGMTTHTIEWRLKRHEEWARKRDGKLQEAIRKYGMDAVHVEILAEVPREELAVSEMQAIAKHNTVWPHGLNMSDGGDGGSRLIANSEVIRIQKMKATMATKEYKKKQRRIQAQVWDEARRAARAEEVRRKWQDPEYRETQRVARTKPMQGTLKLVLSKADKEAKRMKAIRSPEARAKHAAAVRKYTSDPAVRLRISETQRRVMKERPELKLQIALAMSRYRGHTFTKSVEMPNAKKSGVITRTWLSLADVFTTGDLYLAGWRTREIDRAIFRGWIAVHSVADNAGDGYAKCSPTNQTYGRPRSRLASAA